jgi:hypothetical protein
MRYIEMNPVRAALVDDPAHYRWTSYRANVRPTVCADTLASLWAVSVSMPRLSG